MVDQRFIATVDTKGQARFFMCGMDLYNVEDYLYIGGVGGETKTTVHAADAPEYAATRKMLEEVIPGYMEALGKDESHKIGDFKCSCLSVTGYLDARGKDMSACKPEEGSFEIVQAILAAGADAKAAKHVQIVQVLFEKHDCGCLRSCR